MSINKKKICLILMVMALGACNIVSAEGFFDEDLHVSSEQENIKANKDTLEKAQESMNNKDYQSAIVLLTAYITSKPKKYEAYKLRGECFYALRQYKLAERDFQAAIDLKASDDKFLTGTKYISAVVLGADKQEQLQNPELGNLYGELMYAQKALNNPVYEASYDEAVKYNTHIYLPKPKKDDVTKINCPQKYGKQLNPQGVDAEIASVVDDIEAGKFHEAMYKIPSITSNYPKYYLGYYLSGVVYNGMEQADDAIKAFETALKYNPYDFESYASLGEVYYSRAEKTFSSDDTSKSIDYFKKALKYNPHCNTYYFYIGLNELLMKNYQSAINNFNSAIKENSNDYNSMYYKTITEYMNGDYKLAQDDATRLIFKHVSNYNSVLYLRALAKYKQGLAEDALMDIEKIHNNMNDIYNADIKPLSDKERTLVSYLYYLKSEILKSKGMGTKADLQKALENPVIADFVSEQPEIVLTSVQLDNQFDYIRTTFSDYDINYTYLNPDYKLTSVKKPVLNQENVASAEVSEGEFIQEELPDELKPSLAQVLASQSLLSVQNKQPEPVEIEDIITSVQPQQQEILTEPEDIVSDESEIVTSVSEQIVSVPEPEPEPESVVLVQEPVTPKEPETLTFVPEQIEQVGEPVEQISENIPQPIIIEAREKRESQDFQIRYENPQPEPQPEIAQVIPEPEPQMENVQAEDILASKPVEEPVEILQTVENEATGFEEVRPQKPVSNIVEKHADVDLNEFEIPKPKSMPEIKDTDEVIVFEPQNIFNRQEQIVEPEYNELANRLAQYKPDTEVVQPQIEEIQPEPEIIQPETIQIEQIVEKPEPRISEPSLISPEYSAAEKKPVEDVETVVADTLEISPLDELAQMLTEVAELEKREKEGFIEAAAPDENCEITQIEEKPVKEKRRWFRKRVKTEQTAQEVVPAEEEIITVEPAPETQEMTEDKDSAISSIVQTLFNGEDETKAEIKKKQLQEEPVIVQDENLDQLEDVRPLETEVPEEKPVKEKRRWFSRRAKNVETTPSDEAVSETEQEIQETLENSVSEITPEEKPQKFGWFKRLFKRKQKTEVTEIEPVVQLEPDLQDAINESVPQIRMEKADIETLDEINVNEVQAEPVKKKFHWFRRKQKVSEPAEIEVQTEQDAALETVTPVKKVIKQITKE